MQEAVDPTKVIQSAN